MKREPLPGPACAFEAHTGPIERLDRHSFALQLAPHHLNFAGRFHGGMVLTLLTSAGTQVAREAAAERVGPQAIAELLSLDCNFISAAQGAARVVAEVEVTRVTRTVVFLSVGIAAGDEVLSRASAVYRIGAPGPVVPDARVAVGAALEPGATWSRLVTSEPLGNHLAPVYERALPGGPRCARFRVDSNRLASDGMLHEGMALYVADVFTGRMAVAASGARCVTLGMQARRFAAAPPGAWIEFEPRLRHAMPSVVFVDGSFTAAGQVLYEVSTVWKVLGAA